jgi:ABC-type transport system involved in multi-copper enzyme maturation permease subunit
MPVNRDPLPLPHYPAPPFVPEPPSDARRLAAWLRQELSPSVFRRAWRERLAVALVLAGAVLLAWRGRRLAGWQQVALWGALLVAVAVLLRRGWLKLFGPVFFYDLVRTARQGRTFLLRGAYAFALLVVLSLVYAHYLGGGGPADSLFGEAHAGIGELAEFGSGFFLTFLGVQLGAVFLLTPAFTAAAVAEEKEKKTLEYLLVSDLRNREIVLGKLASRLLAMLLLLVGGLPVLSFVQFLGGVDPNLVLAGFAATALMMLSLGSLGILLSVYAPRPRGAVFSTYVIAGGYLLTSGCCGWTASGLVVLSPLDWLAAGNPLVAYRRVADSAAAATGTTGSAVLTVLRDYAAFHATAALLLAGLATLKLRAWNRQGRPQSEREAVLTRSAPLSGVPAPLAALRLPRVGRDAVLWKELYAEHGYRLHPLARTLLIFVGGLLLLLAGLAFVCGLAVSLAARDPGQFASAWVRVVGTGVGCVMVVAVAVRAATSLSSERDRQTLDGLLTTPLSNAALLRGKWLGAVLSVRPMWWCLAAVWLLGFLAGGLHVLSVLLLLAAWWAYVAFAASLGLWFSLRCRTTLRAMAWTLVGLLASAAVPLLWCGAVGEALAGELAPNKQVEPIDLMATTPPGAMVFLTFGWGDWYSFEPALKSSIGQVAMAWASVCGYALAAAALWVVTGQRFGPITGRMPYGTAAAPFSRRSPSGS